MEPNKTQGSPTCQKKKQKVMFNQRNMNCRMFEQSVDHIKRFSLLFELLKDNTYNNVPDTTIPTD